MKIITTIALMIATFTTFAGEGSGSGAEPTVNSNQNVFLGCTAEQSAYISNVLTANQASTKGEGSGSGAKPVTTQGEGSGSGAEPAALISAVCTQ